MLNLQAQPRSNFLPIKLKVHHVLLPSQRSFPSYRCTCTSTHTHKKEKKKKERNKERKMPSHYRDLSMKVPLNLNIEGVCG